MDINLTLSVIPDGLRKPLIEEYNKILQHFLERRWTASELSGGKFCEIVFTILEGYAKGTYALNPFKPPSFVDACRKLENNASVPRSFQILIPRMLPPLYEIRNNRNVGHVGGDVDPNLMDSQAVVSMCSWIMGELIRVLHNVSTAEAQNMVDGISSRKMPLVWAIGDIKRVLKPEISLKDQILLLIGVDSNKTEVGQLFNWIEYQNKAYFLKTLRGLHQSRFIELSSDGKTVEILPPGSIYIENLTVSLLKFF